MNYNQKMEEILAEIALNKQVPTLLLHCCCAPCSSAVLERLTNYFQITVFYYNPNIALANEYQKRVQELKRLLAEINVKHPVTFVEGTYEPALFLEKIKGLEQEKEGGNRCYKCYEMRLENTAIYAKRHHYDYFTTTLSISPHKNAAWLNEIGTNLSEQYQVPYLYADFKKKEGYKRSIVLSQKYHLYRQNYCGCAFSKAKIKERV